MRLYVGLRRGRPVVRVSLVSVLFTLLAAARRRR
jgi:hypothetical protein